MKKKKENECKHINRKITFSYKMPTHEQFNVVKCTDCEMVRYETVDLVNKGKSETPWKQPVTKKSK